MNFSVAWRSTRAILTNSTGIFMMFVYLTIIVVMIITLLSSGVSSAAKTIVPLAGFAAIFWWAFVSSRCLKVLRDADKLMMPAPISAISSALLLQFIGTVIIPSGISALLGNSFLYALATLSALAAGGLLFMFLPCYLGIVMGFTPILLEILKKQKQIPAADSVDYLFFICSLAIGLALLALWRFYRLRYFDGAINSWRSPMALLPDGANGWGVSNWSKSDSGQLLTSGVYFEPAVQRADTNSPKLALRTYLGMPFMPLTRRSQYKQFFYVSLTFLLLILFLFFDVFKDANDDISRDTVMAVGLISVFGLGFTFMAALMRLQALYSKDNAELAELALLPGWKNVGNTRSLLLTVITQHIGRTLLLPASAAFIAVSFIPSESNSGYFFVALFIITSILLAAGYGLNIISGQKRWSWLLGFVCASLFIFFFIQLSLFSLESPESVQSWFAILTWFAFLLFAILSVYFAWRPFKTREHPFLRN